MEKPRHRGGDRGADLEHGCPDLGAGNKPHCVPYFQPLPSPSAEPRALCCRTLSETPPGTPVTLVADVAPCALPAPWRGRGTGSRGSGRGGTERGDSGGSGGVTSSSRIPAGNAELPALPAHGAQPGAAHPPPAMPTPGTAPLRRRLLCRQNFLRRHPALSRPTAGARQLPEQDWESGWRLPEAPAPPRTRTRSGELRSYQMCCEAGMSSGHIWRLCIPSCCPAVQLEAARMSSAPERIPPHREKELCWRLLVVPV